MSLPNSSGGFLQRTGFRIGRRIAFFGLVMLVLGVVAIFTYGKDPKCGDEVMEPGDTCKNLKNGTVQTYEEESATEGLVTKLMLGAGGVSLVVGGAMVLVLKD